MLCSDLRFDAFLSLLQPINCISFTKPMFIQYNQCYDCYEKLVAYYRPWSYVIYLCSWCRFCCLLFSWKPIPTNTLTFLQQMRTHKRYGKCPMNRSGIISLMCITIWLSMYAFCVKLWIFLFLLPVLSIFMRWPCKWTIHYWDIVSKSCNNSKKMKRLKMKNRNSHVSGFRTQFRIQYTTRRKNNNKNDTELQQQRQQ